MRYERDREYALQVIDQCLYGTLSLTGADGEPYGVPISPAREGEYIWFHGAHEGKKMALLAGNPMGHLTCVGEVRLIPARFTTWYQSAMAEGEIEMITDPEEKRHGLEVISRKYAPEAMKSFQEEARKGLTRTAVFRMRIRSLTGKGRLDQDA